MQKCRDIDSVLCFLQGLNDPYNQERPMNLAILPTPTVVLAVQSAPSFTTASPGRGRGYIKQGQSRHCTHFGRNNHTFDTCFAKHGYPPGWKSKKASANQISAFASSFEELNSSAISEAFFGLSKDQLANLIALLPNAKPTAIAVSSANLVSSHNISVQPSSVEEVRKEKVDIEEVLYMVTVKDESDHGDNWFLDTGCSTHMSGKKDWFVEIDFTVKSRVRFADDRTMKVEGVGKVMIKKRDGSKCFISGVLYVPGMKSNLLSIGQLLEKGYKMVLEDCVMKVYDNERRLLIKANLSKNRTFKVELDVLVQQCLASTIDKEEWLWHFRYGHLNFTDLNRLQSKGIVKGIPHIKVPNDVCGECIKSKMSRNSFNQNVSTRSKRKLQVVFSDVCGSIQHMTPGGNKYFVTFIDEFSRKLWIYLIKRKSDVIEVFKKFKVSVEKQCGKNLEILRTDGRQDTSTETAPGHW
ncbi:hypothetical protein JHK82_025305 [Glycine max]|nr:hypothetical protein JHK82_025305 [Glycine max]